MKPFVLNEAQTQINNEIEDQLKRTGKVRKIILKGRQQGCSTYIEGRFFWKVTHRCGVRAFILTHEEQATAGLFEMAHNYYRNCPDFLRPTLGTCSAKELNFSEINSGYKIGTARNKAVGRGHTLQYFHGCLTPDSLIYEPMSCSFTEMKHMNVGDTVMTHTGKLAKISFISNQQKQTNKLVLRTLTKFPLYASDEHQFFTQRGWKELKDISLSDKIGFPVIEITKKKYKWTLPEPNKRAHGGGRQYITPKGIDLDYDFGLLLGLYLADGHIKLQHHESRHPCKIQFAVHRDETQRTIDIIKKFEPYYSSMTVRHREDCLTTEINVHGSQLSMLINQRCGRVATKQFPTDWHLMGIDFCKGLLFGYLLGDGNIKDAQERRIRATPIRPSLAFGARALCSSLGYGWASIENKKAAIRHGRNEKEAFTFSLCGKGVNDIKQALNYPIHEYKREPQEFVEIKNGYAWLPINEIQRSVYQPVIDFEIDHEDHSYCTIHGASHNSETAYWPHAQEHAKGILQAVPDQPDTEVIFESTGNGVGNYYHQLWLAAIAGDTEFEPIFVPWFVQSEYRRKAPSTMTLTPEEHTLVKVYDLDRDQLLWRRHKIAELVDDTGDGLINFMREYPCTANEAFEMSGLQIFIPGHLVGLARREDESKLERIGPKVMACDPAAFGDDRTAIIKRQGRVFYDPESYTKLGPMAVAEKLAHILDKERDIQACFVDKIGIGLGVYDRLVQLGFGQRVYGVNVAEKAFQPDAYRNRRAELWAKLKSWLTDGPVSIPDREDIAADLSSIQFSYDAHNRLQMESKPDMRKRGVKSPDFADAMCMCFAELVQEDTAHGLADELWNPGVSYM